jgi:perosamine synthetase
MTYVATANAVRHVGADPVFVDIDPNTWCIDPGKIEDAITNKTKGIIPVHLFGHPADMDAIYKIARFYRLSVLADAAQSHLATYKGRDIGSVAEVSTYSFHVGKIFTCGEGGVITLSDRNLAQWLRTVRGHGMDPERRFFHMKTAFNFRLTNLQGAVLCGQIERRMEILEKRRKFFTRYQTNLKEVHGLGLQPIAEWAIPCPWVFCITIDPKRFGCTRDQLISILDGKGVESRPFYYPLHRLPAFRQDADRRGTILPIVDNLSKVGMYLPSSTDLSDHEVDYICEIIRSVVCK